MMVNGRLLTRRRITAESIVENADLPAKNKTLSLWLLNKKPLKLKKERFASESTQQSSIAKRATDEFIVQTQILSPHWSQTFLQKTDLAGNAYRITMRYALCHHDNTWIHQLVAFQFLQLWLCCPKRNCRSLRWWRDRFLVTNSFKSDGAYTVPSEKWMSLNWSRSLAAQVADIKKTLRRFNWKMGNGSIWWCYMLYALGPMNRRRERCFWYALVLWSLHWSSTLRLSTVNRCCFPLCETAAAPRSVATGIGDWTRPLPRRKIRKIIKFL